MDEWECRRADLPFLREAEEVAIRVIAVEPWVAPVVVPWLAYEAGAEADPAFVLVLVVAVASCAD